MRCTLFLAGCSWLNEKRVELGEGKGKVDYKQWLGPEWKDESAKWEGAATVIANHVTFFDMIIWYFYAPCFITDTSSYPPIPGLQSIL